MYTQINKFAARFKGTGHFREQLFVSLAVTASFFFTTFFFGPLAVCLANLSQFNIPPAEVITAFFPRAVGLIFAVTLILVLVDFRIYRRAVVLLCVLSVLVWLQGNVFSSAFGRLDGREIHWGRFVMKGAFEDAIWGVCIVVALIKTGFLYKIVSKASIGLLVIQAIAGFMLIRSLPVSTKVAEGGRYYFDRRSQFIFSNTKNVIILLLDSFQSDIFQEIIEEDGAIKGEFRGFIYYRNSLAGYPATRCSLPLILTARYYENSSPFHAFITEAYLSDSIPRYLKEQGFEVGLFPDYYGENKYLLDPRIASNVLPLKPTRNKAKMRNIADVVILKYAPNLIKRYQYSRSPFLNRKEDSMRVLSYAKAFPKISSRKIDKPVFKFYYLPGLHPPLVFNERLKLASLPLDRTGYKTQARGLLELVKIFLAALKRIKAYDNSLIFIIGDHGIHQSRVYIPKELLKQEKQVSESGTMEVDSKALPLILVKPFGAQGDLTVSDVPVSLADIPKTICQALGIPNQYPGYSLFEVEENTDRTRRYLSYDDGSCSNVSDYLTPMEEYLVSGHSMLSCSWRRSGRIFKSPGK